MSNHQQIHLFIYSVDHYKYMPFIYQMMEFSISSLFWNRKTEQEFNHKWVIRRSTREINQNICPKFKVFQTTDFRLKKNRMSKSTQLCCKIYGNSIAPKLRWYSQTKYLSDLKFSKIFTKKYEDILIKKILCLVNLCVWVHLCICCMFLCMYT